jgi:hypothetical protein
VALWLLLAIGSSQADGDTKSSERNAPAYGEPILSWLFQGELDSVTIVDPNSRHCGLRTTDIPGCQVRWESEPRDIDDTTRVSQDMFLMATIPDPLPGVYRIEATARDSTTLFLHVTRHLSRSSGNRCEAGTTLNNLAPGETVTALIKYYTDISDSCALELVGP